MSQKIFVQKESFVEVEPGNNDISSVVFELISDKLSSFQNGIIHIFVNNPLVCVTLNNHNFSLQKSFSQIGDETIASIIGFSLNVPFSKGKLVFKNIYLYSFLKSKSKSQIVLTIKRSSFQSLSQNNFSKGCFLSSPSKFIKSSNVKNGIIYFSPTDKLLSLTLNENWDSSVRVDMNSSLIDICNKNDLLKSSLIGSTAIIPVQNANFVTGTWQGLWACQFGKGSNFVTNGFSTFGKTFSTKISVSGKRGFFSLTDHAIMNSVTKISTGLVHFFIQHTSCTICLHKRGREKQFRKDIDELIQEDKDYYQHIFEGSDDMPAHIKTAVLGPSVSIPIKDGELVLDNNNFDFVFGEFRNSARNRKIICYFEGY